MITSSTINPEQKRLDGSTHTGGDQTNIRIDIAAETGNRAQFAGQMPEHRHHGSKGLDRSAAQWLFEREDVLLGECRFKITGVTTLTVASAGLQDAIFRASRLTT